MTKTLQHDLAGSISDVGEVDMWGLDEFGNPVGFAEKWGAMLGGGVSTATGIAVRALSKPFSGWWKWSDGLGFGAGVLASGLMYAFEKSRAAGLASVGTAFVTSGLRQLETLLLAPSKEKYLEAMQEMMAKVQAALPAPATTATTPGVGGDVRVEVVEGVGIHSIEPSASMGNVAVNGPGSEAKLLGATGHEAKQEAAELIGVPGLSDLAGAFGATHFNGAGN